MIDTIVTAVISVFYTNFYSLLKFKWYKDFYYTRDRLCRDNGKSTFEIESYRYNIYKFLYDIDKIEDNYGKIKDEYNNSYFNLLIFFFILVVIFMYFKIYIPSILFIIVMIIFFSVNSIVLNNFKEIDKMLDNENNDFIKYQRVYKILNVFILENSIQNDKMEYINNILNKNDLTLDKILEKNIYTYENTTNTAKIKLLKSKAYKEYDILRYFILDKSSPYFLKFFENIYVKYFDKTTNTISKLDIKYKDNTINFDTIRKLFFDDFIPNVLDKIDSNNPDKYIFDIMKNKIQTLYPNNIDYENLNIFWNKIYGLIVNEISIKNNDSILYDKIMSKLTQIKYNINLTNQKEIYDKLNKNIHKKLNFDILNNDYIRYLDDNKNILFEKNYEFNDLNNLLDSQSNLLYTYLIYIYILGIVILHYLYSWMQDIYYSYIIIGLIFMYVFIFMMYSKFRL